MEWYALHAVLWSCVRLSVAPSVHCQSDSVSGDVCDVCVRLRLLSRHSENGASLWLTEIIHTFSHSKGGSSQSLVRVFHFLLLVRQRAAFFSPCQNIQSVRSHINIYQPCKRLCWEGMGCKTSMMETSARSVLHQQVHIRQQNTHPREMSCWQLF